MRKILVFMLVYTMFTLGFSAKKVVNKEYDGEYTIATNTFTYKKDNLIFPDKMLSYSVQDNSELLSSVLDFVRGSYGVTEDQTIGLKISGRVQNGVMIINKIENYRIPEENLNARTNYLLQQGELQQEYEEQQGQTQE